MNSIRLFLRPHECMSCGTIIPDTAIVSEQALRTIADLEKVAMCCYEEFGGDSRGGGGATGLGMPTLGSALSGDYDTSLTSCRGSAPASRLQVRRVGASFIVESMRGMTNACQYR